MRYRGITCLLLLTLLISSLYALDTLPWTGLTPEPTASSVPTGPVLTRMNLDVLLQAMMKVESNSNPKAVSRRGARGLMQIRPRTWRWVCRKILKVNWDFQKHGFNPEKNIIVGRAYLEYLISQLGSIDAALCAYHCGPTRYLNNQVPATTLTYLKKVKELYTELLKT